MLCAEIVRNDLQSKVYIGLDYFDASINRIVAWVIGSRNTLKSLLIGLLEPTQMLRDFEKNMDYTSRLAILEELKSMPWAEVWDEYCIRNNVPTGTKWLVIVKTYEKDVLSKR